MEKTNYKNAVIGNDEIRQYNDLKRARDEFNLRNSPLRQPNNTDLKLTGSKGQVLRTGTKFPREKGREIFEGLGNDSLDWEREDLLNNDLQLSNDPYGPGTSRENIKRVHDIDVEKARRERAKERSERNSTLKNEFGLDVKDEDNKKRNEILDELTAGGRMNMFDTPDGGLHIDYRDGKLIAGGVTNAGVIPEYEIEWDDDAGLDGNLEKLWETIAEKHPEYND